MRLCTTENKFRQYLLLTIATTTLTASAAFAQTDVQLGTVHVRDTVDQSTYNAKRSITATKTDTPLLNVPQSITVVGQKELEDRAVTNMADAVRYVPGVNFAQGEGNRDTPIFRGVSTTSDFFLDGVRDDTEYFRDVYNIERVEVLRGPNAMIFGRGAAGGLINRVTRMANFDESYEARIEGGSFGLFRGTFDANHVVTSDFSLRLTGLYHRADSYREGVNYERWGINPTAAFALDSNTAIRLGYEHFYDRRIADRGVPSFQGAPLRTSRSTFFGDPDRSPTYARVNNVTADIEHVFAENLSIRNKTRYADYNKFYQNVYPTAVNAAGTTVTISAYNNAQRRKNLFNQTDVNWSTETGSVRHTILLGAEIGRQETDNVRASGTFAGAGSITVPISTPRVSTPIVYATAGTDGTNHGVADIAAFYIQDQIEIIPELQVIAGVRFDDFSVNFLDRRGAGTRIKSNDSLWSPRVGVIFKPEASMSLYASYSNTFQPRAGSQLASLATGATAAGNPAFDPEIFTNYEVGGKWDIYPELTLSAAAFLLERGNVVVPNPVLAGQGILIDGQNTKGIEIGLTGQVTREWSVVGGYSYQFGKARTTATGPYTYLGGTPEHTFSFWNRYDFRPDIGVGVGVIHQSNRFTTNSNTVTLPAYTRLDAAVYYRISETFTAQLNVENIFDASYFENAHNDKNITPAAPQTFRFSLSANF